MKKLLFLFLFILPLTLVSAQQLVKITGKVTDQTNLGLPGVTVIVQGTQTGTFTNLTGEYTVNAATDATLVFSFVGYKTATVPVDARTIIDLKLSQASYDMDEVVVVGYGSTAVKDLTAPVTTVKADEITKNTVTNIAQALQGKVAGVQITSSGAPGASPTIRIRGLGTVSSNPNPLYVVDGVFVDDINFLSPYQIESATVLKDASSAAIYGNRAANGVILITTKKGKNQTPHVSYSGYAGIQKITNQLQQANREQYFDLVNEKLRVTHSRDSAKVLKQFDPSLFPDETNWFDDILRTANIQSHDLNVTGGNEYSTYNFGVGITSQEGMIRKNDYTRITLRGSQDINVNKYLKTGYSINLSTSKTDNPADVFMNAYKAPPIVKPMINDSTYSGPVLLGFASVGNPVAQIAYINNVSHGLRALSNAYAELTPIKGLNIRSSFTFDGGYSQNRNYSPYYYVSSIQYDTVTSLSKSNAQSINYTFDNLATYEKVIGDHRLKAMGGLSYVQNRNQSLYAYATEVPYFTESTLYISNGSSSKLTANDAGSLFRTSSYFGRLFYSYKDRYLFTGTMRRDGSSSYPKSERWGTFPSIGLGWVVSQENFMQNVKQIDFLKIRGSWGVLGNNNIQQNAYTVTVNQNKALSVIYGPYGSGTISEGATISSVVEPLLKWEIVEEFDGGIEAVMLNSRLNIELDYYHRLTKDAIFPIRLIETAGTATGSFLDNNADILNKGIEATLNWSDDLTDKLSYRIGGNLTVNHNEVAKLKPGGSPFYDGGAVNGALATYTQVGHPIGEFYVVQVDGIFQNWAEVDAYVDTAGAKIMPKAVPGDFRYVDQNHDGKIDDLDRVGMGSYTPKMMYAFNLGITYSQIDVSVECQGVSGNKIYNVKRADRFGNENYDADFAEHRWHGQGTSTTYPSADIAGGRNVFPNSFFVESGAYFRIKNIQVGYTLPANWTNRIHAGSVRFYYTAQNPFTTFKYNGFSPEIPGGSPATQGMDYGIYPLSKINSIGVNVNF
jgi:TonB-linked SusC/RagA family outer membrane protein